MANKSFSLQKHNSYIFNQSRRKKVIFLTFFHLFTAFKVKWLDGLLHPSKGIRIYLHMYCLRLHISASQNVSHVWAFKWVSRTNSIDMSEKSQWSLIRYQQVLFHDHISSCLLFASLKLLGNLGLIPVTRFWDLLQIHQK